MAAFRASLPAYRSARSSVDPSAWPRAPYRSLGVGSPRFTFVLQNSLRIGCAANAMGFAAAAFVGAAERIPATRPRPDPDPDPEPGICTCTGTGTDPGTGPWSPTLLVQWVIAKKLGTACTYYTSGSYDPPAPMMMVHPQPRRCKTGAGAGAGAGAAIPTRPASAPAPALPKCGDGHLRLQLPNGWHRGWSRSPRVHMSDWVLLADGSNASNVSNGTNRSSWGMVATCAPVAGKGGSGQGQRARAAGKGSGQGQRTRAADKGSGQGQRAKAAGKGSGQR